MSKINTLFRQSGQYFLGHALITVAGFISFPIFTRVFSVNDYGTLGIINVTIFFCLGLMRLGGPNALVRFYGKFSEEKKLPEFFSTIFFGYSFVAISSSLIFCTLLKILNMMNYISKTTYTLFLISLLLIFFRSISSIISSSLRAEQKVILYNLILVFERYFSLTLSIVIIFYSSEKLKGYLFGQISVAIIILIVLCIIFFKKNKKISIKSYSFKLFSKLMKFGAPLTLSEFGHLFLSYADRYMIQYYLGASSVGLYAAGYNLATYVTVLIMYPLSYAIDPIYFRIYSENGLKNTEIFMSKVLRYFILVIFPLNLGFIAIGKNLLQVLASSKYQEANIVIPYVIIGNSIYASQIILNAGLVLANKTYIIMIVKLCSCLLNILLNVYLIPLYGIVGAAQATLFSYAFYTAIVCYFSFKEICFHTYYKKYCVYIGSAVIMYIIINIINVSNYFFNLLYKIIGGVIIYSFLIILLDKEIREIIYRNITKLLDNKT